MKSKQVISMVLECSYNVVVIFSVLSVRRRVFLVEAITAGPGIKARYLTLQQDMTKNIVALRYSNSRKRKIAK